MNYDSVCNTIHLGGTILKTSRSQEFMTHEGRVKAAKNLNDKNIDALICCGGNGSYAGLKEFANKDTGDSHSRHFIVEVMGRHCGDIAQAVGLASGATFIAIPEEKTDIKSIIRTLRKRGHDIVVIAEGNNLGGAEKIAQLLEEYHREMKSNSEFRACILGHIQRGAHLQLKIEYLLIALRLKQWMLSLVERRLKLLPIKQMK